MVLIDLAIQFSIRIVNAYTEGLKDRGMGCAMCISYILEINKLWMNHFEAHLMVSSNKVDSKVLWIAFQFEYFFSDKKGKMANVMLETLNGYSSVWFQFTGI